MSGYIKLYRQFLKWEWYDDINTKCVFIHCLLRANHEAQKWHGQEINPGQFITSLDHLAKELDLSVSKVRTSLEKLESTQEIARSSQGRNTTITIKNWDKFQENRKIIARSSQDNRKVIATNNNEKNDKNEKKERIYSALSQNLNPDLMFNKDVNKVFDLYRANCPSLIPLKFEERDLSLRQAILDFLIFISFDFSYFLELCQKANTQRFLLDNKIDIKSLIKNHSRIYSGFYNAQNTAQETNNNDMERENRIRELQKEWNNERNNA